MAVDPPPLGRTVEAAVSNAILVRAPNWVGDAVMSLPFFASLAQNAPDAKITCLCRRPLVPIYETASGLNRIIPLDDSVGARGWRSVLRNAAHLRREDFDLGFCLPPSFGSALMFWWGGVPRRVGHATDRRRFLLSDSLPLPPEGQRPHRTESYLSLLDCVWPQAKKERALQFRPSPQAEDVAAKLWTGHRLDEAGPVLAIAPGTAQPARRWFPDRFAALARRWVESTGGAVVFVGSPSESDLCRSISEQTGTEAVRNLAGAGDIAVAAALLRRADAFVGNDSGLAHLAAAVATPTIVISGPGDPSEIAPYSPRAVSVKRQLFCSPCHKGTCWRTDKPLECLDLVSVDDVWERVEEIFRGPASAADRDGTPSAST
ncbi:MAG TPA: lipopolysaccharide heptosyltransferase II [Acidobacteriota bacterium]|nr:lipopolysaccharide heptosyltransferase II [Acidobacteriota bacterium]